MTSMTDSTAAEKFCILTTQRSGSTWFSELLNNHEDICMLQELFLRKKTRRKGVYSKNPREWPGAPKEKFAHYRNFIDRPESGVRPISTFRYLNEFGECFSNKYYSVGFKLMYNQLVKQPEVLLKLAVDNYKIIHLIRSNYLDVLISKTRLKKGGSSHAKSKLDMEPVILETSSLLRNISIQRNLNLFFSAALKLFPNPTLEVSYCDLKNNRKGTLESVEDFLGVRRMNFSSYESRLHKMGEGTYKEKIMNYKQVEEVLSGTKYESLLN